MSVVPFYYVTTISGVQYELSGNVTTKTPAIGSWQQIKFTDSNSKSYMSGLFRYRLGSSPLPAPVWSVIPDINVTFGTASTNSFSSYVFSQSNMTFSQVGVYPSQLFVDSQNKNIVNTSSLAVSTYSGLRILATDQIGQTSLSFPYAVISALGAHPPSWNTSVSLISVQQGGVYNLNTICTEQDPGDSITYSPLLTLPLGISLNATSGALSVSSNVSSQGYSVKFRATDLTLRTADSNTLTLSVTASSVVATPSWSSSQPLSFNFTPGVSSQISLSQYVDNWNASSWVIQLANASDPGGPSDMLPKGIGLELDGTLSYDGLGPASTVTNVFFKINSIQQDAVTRYATRGIYRSFSFDTVSDLGQIDGLGGNPVGIIFTDVKPNQMPVLDASVKASGVSSARFYTDLSITPGTLKNYSIGTGDGVTKTFSGTLDMNGSTSGVNLIPMLPRQPTFGGGIVITTNIGGSSHTTQDGQITPVTNAPNRAATFTGSGVTGTLNYVTGAYSITYTTAPDNGASLTAAYRLFTSSNGNWYANFADDWSVRPVAGDEYFIQWRERFDQNRLYTGGLKICLDSWSDEPGCTPANQAQNVSPGRKYFKGSATVTEICVQQVEGQPFPGMYTAAPGFGFFDRNGSAVQGNINLVTNTAGDINFQNARPAPFCLNNQAHQVPPFSNTSCFFLYPNEWMTFMLGVRLGAYVPHTTPLNPDAPGCFAQSRIRLWMGRDPAVVGSGAASRLQPVIDVLQDVASLEHGKIWLTTRSSTPAFIPNNEWRDEVIISRYPIASPS